MTAAGAQSGNNDEVLRVVTFIEEPWVMKNGNLYYGFHADLWDAIAKEAGLPYEFIVVDEWAKMQNMIEAGTADVAVEHLGVNATREAKFDFTHEVFGDGLQVVISRDNLPIASVFKAFTAPQTLQIIMAGLLVLLLIAHFVWLAERSQPDSDIPKGYLRGIQYSLSWAVLTIISQEGIIAKNRYGKAISTIWFFFILFALSAFTAQLATAFTVGQLNGSIESINDLKGKKVGTWPTGKQRLYLETNHIDMVLRDHTDELLSLLKVGQVDALLLDTGNAYYFTNEDPSLALAGGVVRPGSIAYFIVQGRTDLVERINRALLTLKENGNYDLIYKRYFGTASGAVE